MLRSGAKTGVAGIMSTCAVEAGSLAAIATVEENIQIKILQAFVARARVHRWHYFEILEIVRF